MALRRYCACVLLLGVCGAARGADPVDAAREGADLKSAELATFQRGVTACTVSKKDPKKVNGHSPLIQQSTAGKKAPVVVAKLLESEDVEVHLGAANAIYECVDAAPVLNLTHQEPRVAMTALRAFAQHKDPRVRPVLLELLLREKLDEGHKVDVMQSLAAASGETYGYGMHNWGPAKNQKALRRIRGWALER